LFGPTVIRLGNNDAWYLMNHPEGGWASYSYRYERLDDLMREWDVVIDGEGWDETSFVLRVSNRPEANQ
jgi:hypothetical protein